ncbi:hypothetical protein IH781_01105 [Patescibacteria group bacterium]|nr:hypothetical protein [Patescibacteria group bacterium]
MYLPATFSALGVSAISLAIVLTPGIAIADTGTDDQAHEETAVIVDDHAHNEDVLPDDHAHDNATAGTESSGLSRLLANRIIYLVVSIIVMTGLTWGVFAVTRKKEIKSPSDNPVS